MSTIVDTLEARVKSTSSANKAQLTRHVNALAARLDDQLARTRDVVRAELKAAMSAGGLDRLETAVARAGARVDAAELAQADAITRINRHLADIARAVDARIAQEARDRVRDIRGVEARLQEARTAVDARIDAVERDSADALSRVGEQVVAIHDKLDGARQGDADTVTEKVNELALQTQAELERHHAQLDTRLSGIEARQGELDARAQQIAASHDPYAADRLREQLHAELLQLRTRIEGLERDSVMAAQQAAAPAPGYVTPPIPHVSAPNPAAPVAHDAPVPAGSPANPYAAALQPAPSAATPANAPAATARADHEPVEFDPAAYAEQSATVVAFAPAHGVPAHGAPASAAPATHPAPPAAPALPEAPAPVAAPAHGAIPAPIAEPDFEPAPLPGMPYANPAYAEDSPVAVRIGGTDSAPRSRPSLKGRIPAKTLKIGALVTGVSVAALFTAKSLLGGNPAPQSEPRLQPMLDIAPASMAGLTPVEGAGDIAPATSPAAAPAASMALGNVGGPTPIGLGRTDTPQAAPATTPEPTIAPIGQYVEARPVAISRDALESLEAAVKAGDPVAQFQLALARIEQGDAEAGAKLLRRAAESDQPAALYRLAKLYESGQGVEADYEEARRLIERAARGGNRIAMHDLALYYTEGRGGLNPDILTARSWFEQAALRGVIDSQYNLALLSETADGGLQPNREDAMFWYSVAAKQGDQYAIGRRDALAAGFTTEESERIAARVRAFAPRPIDEEANGIFGPQPWTPRASATRADATVITVQSLLGRLGFDAGTPDGLMGARTRTAITAFQRANGLAETGTIDPALVERLELAAGA